MDGLRKISVHRCTDDLSVVRWGAEPCSIKSILAFMDSTSYRYFGYFLSFFEPAIMDGIKDLPCHSQGYRQSERTNMTSLHTPLWAWSWWYLAWLTWLCSVAPRAAFSGDHKPGLTPRQLPLPVLLSQLFIRIPNLLPVYSIQSDSSFVLPTIS
jgi:hypothetical protein